MRACLSGAFVKCGVGCKECYTCERSEREGTSTSVVCTRPGGCILCALVVPLRRGQVQVQQPRIIRFDVLQRFFQSVLTKCAQRMHSIAAELTFGLRLRFDSVRIKSFLRTALLLLLLSLKFSFMDARGVCIFPADARRSHTKSRHQLNATSSRWWSA